MWFLALLTCEIVPSVTWHCRNLSLLLLMYSVSGISMSGHPDLYRRNPLPQLLPFKTKAWIRKWDGAGYFYPPSDAWAHEQVGPGIPRDSYRFHNEEDWIKFKYMSETPQLEYIKMHRTNVPLPPNRLPWGGFFREKYHSACCWWRINVVIVVLLLRQLFTVVLMNAVRKSLSNSLWVISRKNNSLWVISRKN